MALAFNQTKGSAKKSSFDQYEYKTGDNKVRFVGGILPRYVYWVEGTGGKKIPMECLAFDRSTETFNNLERDYVQEFYPDLKCSWSYAILCIDPSDNKVKVLNLKRKLLEQIMVTAEDLGDPTDPITGWNVCFKKVKTGAQAFNVEYQLQPLKCKPIPLTKEELDAVAKAAPIDEVIVRPTPESQRKFLEELMTKQSGSNEIIESAEKDLVESEFDIA